MHAAHDAALSHTRPREENVNGAGFPLHILVTRGSKWAPAAWPRAKRFRGRRFRLAGGKGIYPAGRTGTMARPNGIEQQRRRIRLNAGGLPRDRARTIRLMHTRVGAGRRRTRGYSCPKLNTAPLRQASSTSAILFAVSWNTKPLVLGQT